MTLSPSLLESLIRKQTLDRKHISISHGREQQGHHELSLNYDITPSSRLLGSGAYGRVFHTKNKQYQDLEVAIKVLDKQKLQEDIDLIIEEVAILNKLDHPNIVRYYETYDDKQHVYLVMEYVRGE